jgi:hypothetical protein
VHGLQRQGVRVFADPDFVGVMGAHYDSRRRDVGATLLLSDARAPRASRGRVVARIPLRRAPRRPALRELTLTLVTGSASAGD